MADVTHILSKMEQGDAAAAKQLLPLVYEELRQLAASKLAREKPGQTLQATALVHEAYMRLVKAGAEQSWDSRGHFFAAAAESMRRILVENARRKQRLKHGGGRQRIDLDHVEAVADAPAEELLSLDEALGKLEQQAPDKAKLVKLRYFGGFTVEQAADLMGVSPATAKRYWSYARAWLYAELHEPEESSHG